MEKNKNTLKLTELTINSNKYKVEKEVYDFILRLLYERDLYKKLCVLEVGTNVTDVIYNIVGEIQTIYNSYKEIPDSVMNDESVSWFLSRAKELFLSWQYNYRWCLIRNDVGELIILPECRLVALIGDKIYDNKVKPITKDGYNSDLLTNTGGEGVSDK